jgi:hypothetical protein
LASDETRKKKVEKCRGVAVLMFVWWRRATSGAWNHQPWNLFGHGSWIPLSSRDYYILRVCVSLCVRHTQAYIPASPPTPPSRLNAGSWNY